MLFHADKSVKDNLLQMYKRDAMDFANKKQVNKAQRIMEERAYLESLNQKEQLAEDKIKIEKIKKVSERMDEYTKLLNQKNEDRHLKKSKYNDININTYGISYQNSNTMTNYNPNRELNNNNNYRDNLVNNGNFNPNSEVAFNQKVSLSPKVSNIGKLIGDNVNKNEYDYAMRSQKYEQQRMYKDYLDSQVYLIIIISRLIKNMLNLTQETVIQLGQCRIIHVKYFINISDNFKSYEIGLSNLSHNPILNPTNNYNYNKYISLSNNIPPSFVNNSNKQNMQMSNMNSNYEANNNYYNDNNMNMDNSNNVNYNPYNNYGMTNNNNVNQPMINSTTPSGERLRFAGNSLMR
jgi:hypothetical protein